MFPVTLPRTMGVVEPMGSMVGTPLTLVHVAGRPGQVIRAVICAHVFVGDVGGMGLGRAGVSKFSGCGKLTRLSAGYVAACPSLVSAVTLLPSTQSPTPARGDESDP